MPSLEQAKIMAVKNPEVMKDQNVWIAGRPSMHRAEKYRSIRWRKSTNYYDVTFE